MRADRRRRGGALARRVAAALLSAWALPLTAYGQFPAEIRGTVVGAESGVPISGAIVDTDGGGPAAVTGPDGGFGLRGLAPGRREVRVSAFGYRERRIVVGVQNGRVETITVELLPDPVALSELIARGGGSADAGAITIARELIERSGARDLSELLETQPGLTVTRRGGSGSPATLSIRGSSADEVLVLLDGIPLNSPLTGEADFSAVPLEVVERVTVLRGAQSARYGPRALAGVIIIETRRPSGSEAAARGGVGAWGEYGLGFTAGDRASLRGRGLDGLVGAELRSVRGDFPYRVPFVRGGGEARRRNADSRLLSILAQVAMESGSDAVLRGRVEWMRMDRGMPGSIVQPARWARQVQHRRSLALGGSGYWRRLDWRLDLDAQAQDASFRDPAPPLGPGYDERVNVRTGGAAFSVGADATRTIALRAGVEAREMEITSSMLPEEAPRGQDLAGLWGHAQASTSLRNGWTAAIKPALRLDQWSLLDGLILSPRLGASISGSGWVARVSVGDAFSPPSLADQFFQEGLLTRPNPHLLPERVRGEVEVGLHARDLPAGGARIDVELAAHRSDVEGMILWFPDHRFVWQPDNFDVRRRGWEAATRWRFPRLEGEARGSVSRSLVEYAGASLTGQVRYRPALTAHASAAARAFGVRTELSARHVGARRTVAASELNTLSPYWLSDLRVSRPARWGGWGGELSVAVENLFDREAAMLVDYPFPGRAWSLQLRVRREPRRQTGSGEASPFDP